jgi:hypothetical protein
VAEGEVGSASGSEEVEDILGRFAWGREGGGEAAVIGEEVLEG